MISGITSLKIISFYGSNVPSILRMWGKGSLNTLDLVGNFGSRDLKLIVL
jgi:hypothetical protein